MEEILSKSEITDEFLTMFMRLEFKKFKTMFDYDDEKKIRNDYDNRLKGKNLSIYFFYLKQQEQQVRIAKLERMNKLLSKQLAKASGINSVTIDQPKK